MGFHSFCDKAHYFLKWEGGKAALAPGEKTSYTAKIFVEDEDDYFLEAFFDGRLTFHCEQQKKYSGYKLMLHGMSMDFPIHLSRGENILQVTLANESKEELDGVFKGRVLDAAGDVVGGEEVFPLPALFPADEEPGEVDVANWTPGAGAGWKSAGRFGFTKGDGILDCSVAGFGVITRPFISGFPKFKKNLIWNFSILPPGEEPSGNLTEAYKVPENEKITNDWSGVIWERKCKNGKDLKIHYSVLTPGVLAETNDTSFTLSGLAQVGGYKKITLPLAGGAVTREAVNGVFYDRAKDGDLARNWILLTENGQYPEVPLEIVLKSSPEKILEGPRNSKGKADKITFDFAGEVGHFITLFPYGIELFQPYDLTYKWYEKAIPLAAARAQYAVTRPESCQEYFKADVKKVDIKQVFTYKVWKDAFNTPPKYFAPLPPPLTLCQDHVKEIQLPKTVPWAKNPFPTKYGFLSGVDGTNTFSYTLPVPETRHSFPFSRKKAEEFKEMLGQDFDEFMHFHLDAPLVGNPGNYSFVFQYSFVWLVFPFLKERERKWLEETIKSGLDKVCDPDYMYIGPGGRHCMSWYTRTEPFSKVNYYNTYLHVSGIFQFEDCTREIIENTPKLMVEVDWGNAMSLYGAYLGAMFTNSWDKINNSWEVFRKAFDYYLVMMDWACLSVGYCENAVSWGDGTNYGGYLGFLNMAELTGHEEDLAKARYAFAKFFALRAGEFYSTQNYFCKYMGVDPYYTVKFFHEETDARRSHLNYPDHILFNNYRSQSFYNMTTEGHYQETFHAYRDFMGDELEKVIQAQENSCPVKAWEPLPEGYDNIYHTSKDVLGWQEVFTYFMYNILLKRRPEKELEREIDLAAENLRLAREFLGHVEWSKRRVPKEWAHVSLLAALYGRDEVQLSSWKDIRVVSAAFPEVEVELLKEGGYLEFRVPEGKEVQVILNGKLLAQEKEEYNLRKVRIKESGKILFAFV